MIGNSLSVLKREDIIDLGITLHKKNYKYVFDITIIQSLLDNLTHILIQEDVTMGGLSDREINILNILNDYGFLEKIKEVYFHHYRVLYPKTIIPQEDRLSKNLKYILECLNENIK
jgi:hypothetical protein